MTFIQILNKEQELNKLFHELQSQGDENNFDVDTPDLNPNDNLLNDGKIY